ncbi:Metallo-dependent phosphatase-like protein [Haematococcus lacustris]
MESTAESYNGLCDGKVDLGRCTGGIARMKKWLDDSRARYGGRDAVLTLNSGDDFIGTVWDRKYGVNQAAHFLGLLQLDASVIGNHEFDWGPDKLSDYLASVDWPVLGAANLEIPKGHRMQDLIKSYISRTMQGYKVCVFGLATIETNPSQAYPIKVKDPYWAAKQLVPKMQKDGCQVIILLSHMGYTSDIVAAQIIPGLHLVVGGHSHALLWNGPAPLWDKNDPGSVDRVWGSYPTWVDSKVQSGVRTPVVQAGWGSRYMGTVQLHLRPPGSSGGSVVAKVEGWPSLLGGDRSDSPYSQDRAMLAEISKWRYW